MDCFAAFVLRSMSVIFEIILTYRSDCCSSCGFEFFDLLIDLNSWMMTVEMGDLPARIPLLKCC